MNGLNYFEIQVNNPEQAITFYSNIFGWEFTKLDMPIDYWLIETDGLHGGMLKRPIPLTNKASGANAFVCSVEVENFDSIAQSIVQAGGSIVLAKFPVTGKCWQGYFSDTEGNTFGIYQVDSKAK